MASATGVVSALGTVTLRMGKVEKTIKQINNNVKKTTKILEAHSALFNTMLKKLNLLTENRQISPSPMTVQGKSTTTPDLWTLQASSKSQQFSQSKKIDIDLKRKAPIFPEPPPDTQPLGVESPLKEQDGNVFRPSLKKIREKDDNGTNPPPATSGGGKA